MQVKLTRDYSCAPEGHTIVRYSEGDVLEGRAAEMALSDKAGKKLGKRTPAPKTTKPAEGPEHEG